MEAAHWNRVKQLFQQALDVPPEQRQAFLAQACPDAPQVRAEVAAMLASMEEAPDFLETPVLADTPGAGEIIPSLASLSGKRIGPYQLARELGHGGMGAVYLAERADDQYQKRVAIKLLRRGLPREHEIRRFLSERQILARLEHPHIARLIDGGISPDGLPYIVMEYVAGEDLMTYCNTHRLSTDKRLRLFLTVCDAVQYAHQRLIVHRDLKPSNILVDASGTVKLLDFGIAKLIDDDADLTQLTATGMQIMTPAYASPEQVRGAEVTTASDVYALGILLYELLTGRRPYDVDGLTPSQIERVVCENEPPRPSSVVTQTNQVAPANAETVVTPATISAWRSTQPERLSRRLAGDLDMIVLKALRKEPERRYATAEQFADDLRRHQSGHPVTARPDTVSYRIATFVRRHRLGVGATVVVLLALIAGITVATWQASVAARERDRAQLEATKASEINAFLQSMLLAADPYEDNDVQAHTIEEALAAASARIKEELTNQPEIEAAVRKTIGIAYQNLGLYDEALPHLQRALEIQKTLHRGDHPDLAQSIKDLALIYHYRYELAPAESLYHEALAMHERMGAESQGYAELLNDYGTLLSDQENYAAAEEAFRSALALTRRVSGPDHRDVATTLTNLALALDGAGKLDEAEATYRESMDHLIRRHGTAPHPFMAITLNNLAFIKLGQGKPEEARDLFAQSLTMRKAVLGEVHPDVMLATHNLAAINVQLGEVTAADSLLRVALHLGDRLFDEPHPYVANSLYWQARLRLDQGNLTEAESLFREALRLRRHIFGDDHPSVQNVHEHLEETLQALSR